MNNERNNTTAGGIGFCGLLAVAFIILKLTGVINWSWLWVLAPIWIPTYGAPAQMDMAVEEMAELTKALCKVKRVSCAAEAKAVLENAVEEMADVQIMLDQLRIIFGRSTAEAEEYKLERLKKRLDAATAAEVSHRG